LAFSPSSSLSLSLSLSLSFSLSLSTIVLVKKKNGEFRFTIDYRKLNAVTQQITYTLPNLNDIFDATGMSGASIY